MRHDDSMLETGPVRAVEFDGETYLFVPQAIDIDPGDILHTKSDLDGTILYTKD